MISLILTALYRYSMLEKLLRTQRAQAILNFVKAWYLRQPRKVQLTVAGVTLVALGWVLLS